MADANGFPWTGSWIWSDHQEPQFNYWLAFRKGFDLPKVPTRATLHITADSRYRVWLNGEPVGQGPVRAWPSRYRFDSYDVTDNLLPGANALAVLVHEFGVGTFQYIPTRPGLLAQINAGDPNEAEEVLVATDQTWRYEEYQPYSRQSMRISCQQGWAEAFDAHRETEGWRRPDFNDAAWEKAVRIGAAGTGPWHNLFPRDVPFLTETPISPQAVLSVRHVHPPHTVWSISLRRNMLPGYREANLRDITGFLTTVVDADFADYVEIEMRGGPFALPGRLHVNGHVAEEVKAKLPPWSGSRRYRARFRHGPNILLWDVSGRYHEWALRAMLDAKHRLSGQAPGHFGGDFSTIEVDPASPVGKKLAECRDVHDLVETAGERMKPVALRDCHRNNITDQVAFAEETERLDPDIARGLKEGKPFTIQPSTKGDTEVLLDLGKMTVGYWELDVESPQGVIIDLLGFEAMLNGQRDLCWEMANSLRYRTKKGRQRYRAFHRRGCRYLALTVRGNKLPVTIHSVRTIQATYPVRPTCRFECDDPLLNRIWEMCARTVQLCMEDTYTDCPTYEQTFWVGDARPEALINHYVFGAYDLTARCLRIAARSLERSDLIESQTPSSWKNVIPAWSFLGALMAEDYDRLTGDDALLNDLYPALVRQARNCKRYINGQGLFSIEAWNLADWAPLDQPNQGVVTPQNVWLGAAWRSLARLARQRGDEGVAREFDEATDALFAAINAHLWNEAKEAYVDCLKEDGSQSEVVSQQSQILALLYGCVPPDREEGVARHVVAPPEGMVRVGTPFFTFFEFEALAALGEFERILAITREKWGMMLERGATTCWETFPGFFESGRPTRSWCHGWSAAPGYFLGAYQLGVRPAARGFGKVLVKPEPAGLTRAEGAVPTPHGPVKVKWEIAGDQLALHVDLPDGVEGRAEPPTGYSGKAVQFTGSADFTFRSVGL